MSVRDWWDLTTEEFALLDKDRTIALLPVAAVEQHGPHLPVRVDAAINAGILTRALALVPETLNLLVLPAQHIGKSDEHLAFPGTLSIHYETLARLWIDLAESVNRAGCRKIVFFNSHGGQPQLIDIVCRDLRVRLGMLAVNCAWYAITEMSDLFDAAELRHGIHGGAVETSIMLHLHPELVKLERARDFVSSSVTVESQNSVLRTEGSTTIGWQAQDLNASGACGNAACADAAVGKELLERGAKALAALLQDVARYPPPAR